MKAAHDNVKAKLTHIQNIDKDTKRVSLSYKAITESPWEKIKEKINQETKIKITNITDKAIFGEIVDSGLSGMLQRSQITIIENHPQ